MKKIISSVVALFLVFCQSAFAAPITPDTYDKLFLQFNATGTTVTDSSTASPKSPTAQGNATQVQYKLNKSALFLDGASYVDVANSSDFAVGTGAFTVEGFFFTKVASTAQTILDTRTATANTTGFLINIINSSGNKLCFTTATTARITGTTTLSANTWYHFMVIGNGGGSGSRTVKLYLDGVQEGSTYTNDYNFTDQTLRIGSIKATAGTYFKGWLKEIRISNTARSVAVPTAEYTNDANTKTLLHFDSPAQVPLAPAIYFDGTGDYLTAVDSASWTPSTNFTVECWVRFNSVALASFVSQRGSAGNVGWDLNYTSSGTKINFSISYDGTNLVTASSTFTPVVGRWYHVAGVKNGNTLSVYVDGIAGATTGDFTSKTATNSTEKLAIGCITPSGTPAQLLTGLVRQVRISDTARYTSSFTPSQTAFSSDANTLFLAKGDEANGATTFTDSSTSAVTITTAGDAKIWYWEDYRSCIILDSETTPKYFYPVGVAKVDFFSAFGTGVGLVDGSGDHFEVADTGSDWDLGTGEWTVETYARPQTQPTGRLFDLATDFVAGQLNSASPYFRNKLESTNYDITALPYMLQDTWWHYCLVRTSNTMKVFLNGILIGSSDVTGKDIQTSNNLGVGGEVASSSDFEGRMDNARWAQGIARYTTTFTPPTDYQETGSPRKKSSSWWLFF